MKKINICQTLAVDIGQQKELKSQNQDLLYGNRQLMKRLFKIQEKERRFLARELHDEFGQWLSAIYVEAETISNQANKNQTICASSQAIGECVKKMQELIHNMQHQLRPVLLDTLGLADALHDLRKQWCMHHSHIYLELKLEGELKKLGEDINITIYRITQEALSNIYKHAQANHISVYLSRKVELTDKSDYLLLSIKDNGKGYSSDQISKGLGLLGMRERAITLGGEFTVHSVPNYGTEINVILPLNCSNRRRRTDDL